MLLRLFFIHHEKKRPKGAFCVLRHFLHQDEIFVLCRFSTTLR